MKNLKVYKNGILKTKVAPLAVAASLLSGSLSFFAMDKASKAEYIPVSNDIRASIYLDNPKFSKRYGFFDPRSNVDNNINDKSLKKVEIIRLDLDQKQDLSFLEYCTNIKVLDIDDAQYLSSNEEKVIDDLELKELNLRPSEYQINVEGLKTDIDLSDVNCDNINVSFDWSDGSELKNYILYLWAKKILKDKDFKMEDKSKYEEIDQEIENIIKKNKKKKGITDEDTLVNVILGTCEYFTYDPEVSQALEDDTVEKYEKRNKNYNKKDLSSTLFERDGNGLCINITSIFSAIAYKMGLEAYCIDGVMKDEEYGHALNIVNIDDDWKYVDNTAINTFTESSKVYSSYNTTKDKETKKENYEKLKRIILNTAEQQADDRANEQMDLSVSLDELTSTKERKEPEVIVNEGLKGKQGKQDIIIAIPFAIGLGTGSLILFVPIRIRSRQEEKELSVEERINKKREELLQIREFLEKNNIKITLSGGALSGIYYLDIMDHVQGYLGIEALLGASFVTSTVAIVYGGNYLLREHLKSKADNVEFDVVKKEFKRINKERDREYKKLRKMTKSNRKIRY